MCPTNENVQSQNFSVSCLRGQAEVVRRRRRGSNPVGEGRSRRLRPDAGSRRHQNPEPEPRAEEKPDPDVEPDDRRL